MKTRTKNMGTVVRGNEKMRETPKEDLLKLLQLSGSLIAALDGLWFLAVEDRFGYPEAIKLDVKSLRMAISDLTI